jgi:hypothetical protein
MRQTIVAVVASLAIAASIGGAMADGLAPCDKNAEGFVDEVARRIGDSQVGDAVVSFVALPAFDAEWGLQVIRDGEDFRLRSVQFKRSVWHGAYREVRPGYFQRDPDTVQPDPIVRLVSLSPELAGAVRDLVITEIAHADPSNARMGLDGEGFYFYANGRCASTWSPDLATSPERLVDILENLKIQAALPSRLVQLFWEKRVLVKLNRHTGGPTMSASQYLVVIALGIGIIAFGALPLLIASVVLLIPRKLPKKRRFVMASGALSYGFTCFVALLLLPFFLIGSQVSAQLAVDGHSSWAATLDLIAKCSFAVLFASWAVFSIAVPIYLRRKFWPNWIGSNETACDDPAAQTRR